MDSAFIIICALILNALVAGPRALYENLGIFNFLRWPARKLREVERKLNREHRPESELEMRGYIVLAAGICAAIAIGWLLQGVTLATNKLFDVLVLALLLPVRPALDFAISAQKMLAQKNIQAARDLFAHTIWRHHAVMDEYSLARAAIETLAVSFAERILCPIIGYMILGLPGVLLCVFITMLHDTVSTGSFSKAAKQAYVFLHWVPSRIAACLWILVSLFMPENRIRQVAHELWLLMQETPPQVLSLAAAGHVLKLSLGGPASVYSGGKWLGNGTPKIHPSHIGKAIYLFGMLHLIIVLMLGLML